MEDRIREVEERSAWLEHRLAEAEEMLRTAFGRIEQLEAELKRPSAASLLTLAMERKPDNSIEVQDVADVIRGIIL